MNEVNTQKDAFGINKPFTPSDISVAQKKEAFANEIAETQKNMNASESELAHDKQKAEDRVKDKTDIPIIDSWLKKDGED